MTAADGHEPPQQTRASHFFHRPLVRGAYTGDLLKSVPLQRQPVHDPKEDRNQFRWNLIASSAGMLPVGGYEKSAFGPEMLK